MKFLTHSILLAALAAAPVVNAQNSQTGSGEIDGYRVVWQDLFDADDLMVERWYIEENGDGGGNHELQYYRDRSENVRLGDDGLGNHCLILTARRENFGGKQFTSGRLNTLGRFSFTHGKIEASIKLPKTANGLWPAFWMMGADYPEVGWPKCGETDILEMGNAEGIRNGNQETFFNGACHWGQGWPAASYANSLNKRYSLQDGEFHLYTLIWTPDEVAMYVDLDQYPVQTPYYRMTIPQDDPGNEWSPGNYFHKPNFVIFNLAVGGDFTGIHNANDITALNDANGHQASMYVNYVRVYQKGSPDENIFMLVPGDTDGIADLDADPAGWEITADAVALPGASSVALYDMAGRCVASAQSDILSISAVAPGVYIARAAGRTCKIAVK